MDNLQNFFNHLYQKEGDRFQMNEQAVVNELQNNEADKTTLSVKIVSVLGGLLATLAFLGFLALTGLFNNAASYLILGFGFITGAIWINKVSDKLIIDTVSVAVYLSGFILLLFGLNQLQFEQFGVCIILTIIAITALYFTQNFILSFISVLVITISLPSLLFTHNLTGLINVYIVLLALLMTYWFFKEADIVCWEKIISRLYNPMRIGLIVSLLAALNFTGKGNFFYFNATDGFVLVSSIPIILIILEVVSKILDILEIEKKNDRVLVFVLTSLILLPTAFQPAIVGSLLVILLSFLVNYKTGFALGIISFIYFLSRYYYDLNFTLLVKSEILIATGVLFLVLYYFINKKFSTDEKL